MMKREKYLFRRGILLLLLFGIWTFLICSVDVQTVEETGTKVGFFAWNHWFHDLTGVHMTLYAATDWLGLVPVLVCACFAGFGLCQLIKRKHIYRVDVDILILGAYYIVVALFYLLFETIPINYRPVLIEGRLECSYPSSTTLLVLSVMPASAFYFKRRYAGICGERMLTLFLMVFSVFMVVGRLVSGVHWVTDIIGAALLSAGLYCLYKATVLRYDARGEGFDGIV